MVRRNLPPLLQLKKERDREDVIHWRWRQYVPPKRWSPSLELQDVASQKIITFMLSATKILNVIFPLCSSLLWTMKHHLTLLTTVQRNVTQRSLFTYFLQVHSTCFGCQQHPSEWPTWPLWRKVAAQKNVIFTGGCSYSFL